MLARKTSSPLSERDPSDPDRLEAESVQRARMLLDAATAAWTQALATFGPSHPEVDRFRTEVREAQDAWSRLRDRVGKAKVESALAQPPLAAVDLDDRGEAWLIPIDGKTYRAHRVESSPLAPEVWRITRLHPPLENGPYYACKLEDGAFQCDCAEWTFRIAEIDAPPESAPVCKHLAALIALGRI